MGASHQGQWSVGHPGIGEAYASKRRVRFTTDDLARPEVAFGRPLLETGRHEALVFPVLAGDTVELWSIVKECLKLLRSSIPSTIEIIDETESTTGAVFADATQTHQVLMNLCTNAHHAMLDDGYGEMRVALEPIMVDGALARQLGDVVPGPYARVRVSDTGCGMDEETRDRIFDPFFTTKKPGQGTGLGLATVHGIIRDHGGAVTVYSEAGVGTAFHVYLPCVEGSEAARAEEQVPLPTGSARVLLVDDERSLVLLAEEMLTGLGYQVTSTTDSRQALSAFMRRPEDFDVVVTDLTMPHLTGSQLAESIKCTRPDLPIILVTGLGSHGTARSSASTNINEVLMKPYSLEQLAFALHRALAEPPS